MAALLAWMLCLQADPVQEAVARFKAAYRTPEAARRAEAVAELGTVEDPRILKILAPLTGADDAVVRLKAVEAVGRRKDRKAEAAAILLSALAPNSKEPKVLIALLDALGALGEKAAVAEVNKRLEHPVNEVSVAAIRAAGGLGSGSSVERLVAMWTSIESFRNRPPSTGGGSPGSGASAAEQRTRNNLQEPVVREALTAITGQTFESPQDAKDWWAANRGTFRDRPLP